MMKNKPPYPYFGGKLTTSPHVKYKPPYAYFGGKLTVLPQVWPYLSGSVNFNFPFFGGGSDLWLHPGYNWQTGQWDVPQPIETVNDIHGFIPNFWRAVQDDPEQVAHHADWIVSECDLHARHYAMVEQSAAMQARLEGDPLWYDAKIAGWWVWGMAIWIGSEFCSGNGPWQSADGELVKVEKPGVNRKRPHLGGAGKGIYRQRPHLGPAQGINRKRPHLGGAGQVADWHNWLLEYIDALSDRLRRVRVCCGDWERVCAPTPTFAQGVTSVFLDPPYASDGRDMVYTVDSKTVAGDVMKWCKENEDNPKMKIALCGYEGDYHFDNWAKLSWSANGGYSKEDNENRHKEVIYFSPHCNKVNQYEQVGF